MLNTIMRLPCLMVLYTRVRLPTLMVLRLTLRSRHSKHLLASQCQSRRRHALMANKLNI